MKKIKDFINDYKAIFSILIPVAIAFYNLLATIKTNSIKIEELNGKLTSKIGQVYKDMDNQDKEINKKIDVFILPSINELNKEVAYNKGRLDVLIEWKKNEKKQ